MSAPEGCGTCRHFGNEPSAIERLYKGLTAMSSAYGSARGGDGICARRDVHVLTADCCAMFEGRKPDP